MEENTIENVTVTSKYDQDIQERKEREEMERKEHEKRKDAVIHALYGHCGGVLDKIEFHHLSHLQRQIVICLAKLGEFQDIETEQSSWTKFTYFNQNTSNKGLARKALLSIIKAAKYREEYLRSTADEQLANAIDVFFSKKAPLSSYETFHGTLQLVAAQLISKELERFESSMVKEEKQTVQSSDSVFGNHNTSSLDQIPF